MVSAPASRSSPKRRASSAKTSRTPKASLRRVASAPHVNFGQKSKARRAFSASPGVRPWMGPRTKSTKRRAPRQAGASTMAKLLTGALSLSATRGAGGPVQPWKGGKSIAVYPLGSSAPYYPSSRTYNYGRVSAYPVVEYKPKRRNPSRKLFPGGHALTGMYEPEMVYHGMGRKMAPGMRGGVPRPVINSGHVLELANQGFKFPKSVLKQAMAGKNITVGKKVPAWTRSLPGGSVGRYARSVIARAQAPPTRAQLALPSGVANKLKVLEEKTKVLAAKGTAKLLTAPWKIAALGRNITGRVANKIKSGAQSVVGAYRSVRKYKRSVARLPN